MKKFQHHHTFKKKKSFNQIVQEGYHTASSTSSFLSVCQESTNYKRIFSLQPPKRVQILNFIGPLRRRG